MGLDMVALCEALLLALVMAGGRELVGAGRGCTLAVVLGVSVASFAATWFALALAANCHWLACTVVL